MKHLAYLAAAGILVVLGACGDDDAVVPGSPSPDSGTDAGATDAGTDADATDSGTDAGSDSGTDAGDAGAALSGSLAIAPGASSAMPAGTFTPTSGSAQWRAKTAGGVLTVAVADADKAVELTVYDDSGALDPDESFAADAPGSFALKKVRVETYRAGTGWTTEGDGKVVVKSFSATAVTLELENLGQFGPGADVFTLAGTVTVPLATLADRSGSATSFTISNLQPEPITLEPNNLTAPATPIADDAPALGEHAVPFAGTRRALEVRDTAGGTKRTLRIAFPSGHYPRAGQDLMLGKFDRVTVTLYEGDAPTDATAGTTKIWEADQGSAEVTARTDTSITVKLLGARMQSESPTAKGLFQLDGTVTFPIP